MTLSSTGTARLPLESGVSAVLWFSACWVLASTGFVILQASVRHLRSPSS